MERRTFLSAGGASVLALAAGYTSVSGTDGPVAVVNAYYDRANEADTTAEFADAVPDLAHSTSPLPRVARDIPRAFDGALSQELVDTEVVDEDIGADEIRNISDFFAGSVSDDEMATLAEDNAVVAVTLEAADVAGGELAKEWLVAPEDGEWRLVWFDGRNSPRASVRRFFRQVTAVEYAGRLDGPVGEFSHRSSPLENVAEYTPWYFDSVRDRTLVGTEVTAENVDIDRIAGQFAPFTGWASDDEVETVAKENAVVTVSLRDDDLGVERLEQAWLVAPDGGEWRVVWF
jgi:hypothetical protein